MGDGVYLNFKLMSEKWFWEFTKYWVCIMFWGYIVRCGWLVIKNSGQTNYINTKYLPKRIFLRLNFIFFTKTMKWFMFFVWKKDQIVWNIVFIVNHWNIFFLAYK
jgi:hypothetical protein